MIKSTDFFLLAPSSREEEPIFNELLGDLYRRRPVNIVASVVAGSLLAFIMASSVSKEHISIWVLFLLAVQLIAVLVTFAFNRRTDLSQASDNKWLYLLGLTVIFDGIAWGLAGYLFYTEASYQDQMLLCVFLMAGAATATITFSSWLVVALIYIVVILAPGTAMLLTSTLEFYRLLGLAAVVFGAILCGLAMTSNLTTTRMLRLRFDNERLVVNLSESHAQLRELNTDLQKNNHSLQRALDRISEMATRDELTGSHNRRHLMEFLAREKARCDRAASVFSLAVIDLDYFKRINDSYGHIAGDDVLKQVVALIQRHVRSTDCFARFGGEEFALVYTLTGLEEARQSAERVRHEISTTAMACDSFTIYTSVSIGIAEYRPGESIVQLLHRADQAMYVAKSGGRDRVMAMSRDQLNQEMSGLASRRA
jgi:diguanylate cyclase (GGDEF)-like protein